MQRDHFEIQHMETGTPSRTAWAAAAHRAAHQVLEHGRIFSDPLAVRILGIDDTTAARHAEERPDGRFMRTFIACRTRFAEDTLANTVAAGVRQLVILGAGLDTYAYRSPFADRLRVFEVDHPSTQAWKRQLLGAAGIHIPQWLTFAPIDFESQTLAAGLANAGFDPAQPSFFTWLGVVPYLTEDAVWSTLGFVAGLPKGAHVIFDYSDPPSSLSDEMRDRHAERAARVAELGEPWLTYLEPPHLHARLRTIGFSKIEDLGPAGIAARYFPDRPVQGNGKGGHVLHASTTS